MKQEREGFSEEDFEELYPGLSGILSFVEVFNKRRRHTGGAGGAPVLLLSNNTIRDNASVGDLVGALSVANGTGVYIFSLLFNPSGLFQVVGNQLQVGAALAAGVDSIIVQANNGAGSLVLGGFFISVSHFTGYVPTYELLGF